MLKQSRIRAGLSQWELAAKSGLSIRTVGRAENGKTVSSASLSRIYEVLDMEVDQKADQELVSNHKGTVEWLDKHLPIHFPPTAPNGYNNSLTIERMANGYVIWSIREPWAIGVDGYMIDTSKPKRLVFKTLEEVDLTPDMFVWPDLAMAVAQAASSMHLPIASKRVVSAMSSEEFLKQQAEITGRTRLMSTFERAGYPGKVKERTRLLKEFDNLIQTVHPDQAAELLIKEIVRSP